MDLEEMKARVQQAGLIEVTFMWGNNRKMNAVLTSMNHEERIEFLRGLTSAKPEDLVQIIGENAAKHVGDHRELYTLTADGRQFRCWFGHPGGVNQEGTHVDSCGSGLFFDIRGDPETVQLYVQALAGRMEPLKSNRSGVTYYVAYCR